MSQTAIQQRAEVAFRTRLVFAQYQGIEGETKDDITCDLVNALMHLADEEGLDFNEVLTKASFAYQHEVDNNL